MDGRTSGIITYANKTIFIITQLFKQTAFVCLFLLRYSCIQSQRYPFWFHKTVMIIWQDAARTPAYASDNLNCWNKYLAGSVWRCCRWQINSGFSKSPLNTWYDLFVLVPKINGASFKSIVNFKDRFLLHRVKR